MNLQAGSFWSAFGMKFGTATSPIDTILARPSFELEELLDEEDLLGQCKYNNPSLLEYLSSKHITERLVKYIIMKPEEDEKETMMKYPYICSELFASESNTMLDTLFEHEELLLLLFSILDRPPPLDPPSVGYFRKVVFVSVQRKYDLLVDFMKRHNQLIGKMVQHIGLYSVMDILMLIGWDDALGQVSDVEWLYKQNLIPKLVNNLAPEKEAEYHGDVHANSARALVDIVMKCPVDQNNFLITHLQSQPMLVQLYKHAFAGSQSSLTKCLSVMSVLLHRKANQQHQFPDDSDEDDWGTPHLLTEAVKHLPKLYSILKDKPVGMKPLPTQYGELTPPLGEARMQAVELFLVLFRCKDRNITNELVRLNVLEVLLNLMFEYQWNNMLHGLVESIVNYIMDAGIQELHVALFEKAQLVNRLLEAYEKNEVQRKGRRRLRCGFMGHLLRICNTLKENSDPLLVKYLAGSKTWQNFVSTLLLKELEIQHTVLGGERPASSVAGESEEDEAEYDYQENAEDKYKGGVGVSAQRSDQDAMQLANIMSNFNSELYQEWDSNEQGDEPDWPDFGQVHAFAGDSNDAEFSSDEEEDAFVMYNNSNGRESGSDSSDSSSSDEEPSEPLPEVPASDARNTNGDHTEDSNKIDKAQSPVPEQQEDDQYNDVKFWRPQLAVDLDELEEL